MAIKKTPAKKITSKTPPKVDRSHGYNSMCAFELANITYRQLDHWDRIDFVKPSLEEAIGSGSRRLYSYGDIVKLRAIKELRDAGLSVKSIQIVMDNLKTEFNADLATSNLVIDGKTPILATDDELVDLIRGGQRVLNVLPMAPVQQEVDAKIIQLFSEHKLSEKPANKTSVKPVAKAAAQKA